MCSSAPDRSRRRRGSRSRPMSTKAASGRRTDCESRGPASGARSCCAGAGAVLPEQTIATFDTPVQVWDWSRDGRSLLIGRKNNDTGDDLWIQPPVEGAAAQPYVTAPFDQAYGAFSPDGRSIAYASNESGQFDVYVDAYPKPGSRVRVTTAGGTEPRWSADGRELYFRRGSAIHAVALQGSRDRIGHSAVRSRHDDSVVRRIARWPLPCERSCCKPAGRSTDDGQQLAVHKRATETRKH